MLSTKLYTVCRLGQLNLPLRNIILKCLILFGDMGRGIEFRVHTSQWPNLYSKFYKICFHKCKILESGQMKFFDESSKPCEFPECCKHWLSDKFIKSVYRNHSGYGLSQWEKMLLYNVVSHWLRLYPEWSMSVYTQGRVAQRGGLVYICPLINCQLIVAQSCIVKSKLASEWPMVWG